MYVIGMELIVEGVKKLLVGVLLLVGFDYRYRKWKTLVINGLI